VVARECRGDCDLREDLPESVHGDGKVLVLVGVHAHCDHHFSVSIHFADFQSYRVLGEKAARKAKAEGKHVRRVEITRRTAQPPGSAAVEVKTKAEAVRLADELPGTWKHRRRGCYRVVPLHAQRPKRVSHATAMQRVRQGWLPINPLAEVKRTSKRHERQRILRRDDFYDREEIDRLLKHAPSVLEEAFWLLGADAGFRLPGEALGLRKGAVDFQANVIRVYDNWVRNAPDTTKTSDSEAIPMTPRLARALANVLHRDYATENEDFVFASDDGATPVSERSMRKAFKLAQKQAGLKPIKMYNLRHSFGTTLAQRGVDVRTIQVLMRHERITTTEQYMAYRPQPELASQISRALDPHSLPENVTPIRPGPPPSVLERLEEEIPAKWVREVERIFAESHTPHPAPVSPARHDEAADSRGNLTLLNAQPLRCPHRPAHGVLAPASKHFRDARSPRLPATPPRAI
jgi:integrase